MSVLYTKCVDGMLIVVIVDRSVMACLVVVLMYLLGSDMRMALLREIA